METPSILVRIVAGVGTAVVFAAAWGAFVAPKAERRLPDPVRLVSSGVFDQRGT